MNNKKIIVTGIGGNVGQGIIRNIKAISNNITIIGVNTTSFSSGNHLCDKFYKLPYAYEKQYIPSIMNIVKKEIVDLIIPSTDFEIFYLSANRDKLPCELAASDHKTALIFLDKYLSFYH